VAHLVEALPSKSKGRGFDSRWWNFSLTYFFWPHYCHGVDSAFNRNEYKEYFLVGKGGRCVGLTTLSPLCADYHEIWGESNSWNCQDLSKPVTGIALPVPYLRISV
jgi:hypothetical protein